MTDEEEVKKYVKVTVAEFGKIDVFFNNVGVNGSVVNIIELEKAEYELVNSRT